MKKYRVSKTKKRDVDLTFLRLLGEPVKKYIEYNQIDIAFYRNKYKMKRDKKGHFVIGNENGSHLKFLTSWL